MNTTDMHIPSNKVRDIERYFHQQLDQQYGQNEVKAMVGIVFEAFLGWNTTALLLHRDDTVNQSDLLRFHWAVEDLKQWRPIQHIVGWSEFCGCRIDVDQSTLIPRPETEEIVDWTIKKISNLTSATTPFKALDLCTGSGCIAIALAKYLPQLQVTAIDISAEALSKARHNAAVNNVEIDFRQDDILSPQFTLGDSRFDLIISNPPYVMLSEKETMNRNVLDWEPHSALFVPDDDPLRFYRTIARTAEKHLKDSGIVIVEINEQLGLKTAELFEEYGFYTNVHRDFREHDRMLTATKHIE